jgi:hypothetical protein
MRKEEGVAGEVKEGMGVGGEDKGKGVEGEDKGKGVGGEDKGQGVKKTVEFEEENEFPDDFEEIS